MMTLTPRASSPRPQAPSLSRRRCFTLVELLVVMGVIAVLGIVTTLSYRGIAQDAKLASGKNTVAAVLDNARGLAMRNNRIVMVVFRPRLDGKDQYLEAVFAEYRESGAACVGCAAASTPCPCARVVDRFAPIAGVSPRALTRGIKIGSPSYPPEVDTEWRVVSHLPAINQTTGLGERAGEQIAVMYGPDGTVLAENSATDADRIFVDYNNNGFQDLNAGATSPLQILYATGTSSWPSISVDNFNGDFPTHHGYFEQLYEHDEPYVELAPFLAIFDDEEMRELYDPQRWHYTTPGAFANRRADYQVYLNENTDRLHFNRYTGVVMK
jgi:prepilin-type N-terminal cleavage/methylation domain-containing protein